MNELRQYFFRGKQTVITYESDASVSSSSFDQWFGSTTSSFKLYEIKDGVKSVKTPTNLKIVQLTGPAVKYSSIQGDGTGGYKVTITSDNGGDVTFHWVCSEVTSKPLGLKVLEKPKVIDNGDCILGYAAASKGGNGFATAGKENFNWKPPLSNMGWVTTELVHDKQISGLMVGSLPSGYSRRGIVNLKTTSGKWNSNKIRLTFTNIPIAKNNWILDWNGSYYKFQSGKDTVDDLVDYIRANNNKKWNFKIDLL